MASVAAVLVSAALLAPGGAGCSRRPTATVTTTDAGRMGTVQLFLPRERATGVVVLFSGAGGFDRALADAALRLAGDGVLVAGIDLPTYVARLDREQGCSYVLSDVEELAHRLEREQGLARYRLPVLAGTGAGATFAYAALAQAPAATVAGAVGIDPTPALATREPLCPGAPARREAGGFAYGPFDRLPGWWRVSLPAGTTPTPAPPAHVELGAPGAAPNDRLVAALAEALGREEAQGGTGLSVVEYPSESGSDVLTIIYSGDGGWRDLDKRIGEVMAARGLPVVGVDALRSFWSARTPEQMGDLAELIRVYGERWGTKRVVLVGYSFGAGVLPFAIEHLPAADRDRIVLVALLGVEPRADFEIRVTGWLGGAPGETAAEVLPALRKLDPARLQCFYGEEETDSLCRSPALAAAEVVRTGGGHHFDGDYDALARRILDGIERRAPGAVTRPVAPGDAVLSRDSRGCTPTTRRSTRRSWRRPRPRPASTRRRAAR